MKAIIRTFALVFIIFNCLTACTNLSSKTKLYDQLGGTAGITHIVDNLLYELSSNDQVLPLFTNTDIARFRQKMIEFIGNVAGGPVLYSGDNMVRTHKGMAITPGQFNSVVEDLILAMESSGTPVAAQNHLLQLLARYYSEIISA